MREIKKMKEGKSAVLGKINYELCKDRLKGMTFKELAEKYRLPTVSQPRVLHQNTLAKIVFESEIIRSVVIGEINKKSIRRHS